MKHDEVFPRFIYYWMHGREFLEQIEGVKGQTDMADYVNLADQRKMNITLPLLPEQKAIASVLSSLDDKIDLLHHQNKTLEAMAKTMFRQWFLEQAQEEWETVRVGDFVKTNVSSITQSSALKTIRYLDTGSLNEGRIEGFQVFDVKDAPSRARRIVKHNDILISTVRPDQKHYGIIKHPDEDIIVSTGFCVISCKTINPHFIYVLLTTRDMTEYLHSIAEASTSTYPSLRPSDIECLEFKRPPKDKLCEFSVYADNAWDKIEYNHNQICTLEKLRDTLLPKLLSGEVRVDYAH
jgi:type I restriction enzyme S subunit